MDKKIVKQMVAAMSLDDMAELVMSMSDNIDSMTDKIDGMESDLLRLHKQQVEEARTMVYGADWEKMYLALHSEVVDQMNLRGRSFFSSAQESMIFAAAGGAGSPKINMIKALRKMIKIRLCEAKEYIEEFFM